MINIHQAKTHLSSLLEPISRGEAIVTAKVDKPDARLMPLAAPMHHEVKKIGFLEGQTTVPEDFDTMPGVEIALMYKDLL